MCLRLCSGGQCVAEAPFSDRRWQTTVTDSLGFFYVIGGEEVVGGVYTKTNDVWRSSFSMTNKARVARGCKVTYPTCGATGMSCWPSANLRRDNKGMVTCSTLTAYCNREDESSTGDWWASSTGVAPVDSSGLSAGLIVLIVVLLIAGVGAIAGYLYYSKKNAAQQAMIPGIATDNLLAPAHTDSAGASDYYAAHQQGIVSAQ